MNNDSKVDLVGIDVPVVMTETSEAQIWSTSRGWIPTEKEQLIDGSRCSEVVLWLEGVESLKEVFKTDVDVDRDGDESKLDGAEK